MLCTGEGGEQDGVPMVKLYHVAVFAGEGSKYGESQVWRSSTGRDYCGKMKTVVCY